MQLPLINYDQHGSVIKTIKCVDKLQATNGNDRVVLSPTEGNLVIGDQVDSNTVIVH